MGETKKNSNQNNFNGMTNFNGPTQIAGRDIINNISDDSYQEAQEAKYTPEPMWRSPFTMAVLTWISVAIGVLGVFPIGKILKSVVDFFKSQGVTSITNVQPYTIIFIILTLLFFVFLSLRRIVKRQTRHPLLFNFAISGYDGRLTIEKIHIDKCPQCGGNMKYYNKPVEWGEILRSNGSIKREITKRIPVLECKRNSEHCYKVDPAEDKLK
ncbi:hypothetical protein KDN24_08675 [Bacillus sp. Bva_UNVM-123]|uniref:hypothetical protein n=1 Tax=Bacillus sp. Bva_UNVM-123 TaxID=2829798 RepID=UPI00391F07C6